MMFGGIVLFGILAAAVSMLIFKKYETLEKAELSTYIVMIAWGGLLFGLCIARL